MSSLPITVRRIHNPSDTEVQQIVHVLQSAFGEDDPFTNVLVGGDTSLISAKFESNVRAGSIGGEIHIATLGPEIIGAAVWYGPGQSSMSTEEQREVGSRKFFSLCPDELKKWWMEHFLPSMERLANDSFSSGFKEAQWSLLLLGVVPEHHRKGVAKALMKVTEDRAKADGVSIVLETITELDLLIYKRLGFEVKGQVTIPSSFGQYTVYQLMRTP